MRPPRREEADEQECGKSIKRRLTAARSSRRQSHSCRHAPDAAACGRRFPGPPAFERRHCPPRSPAERATATVRAARRRRPARSRFLRGRRLLRGLAGFVRVKGKGIPDQGQCLQLRQGAPDDRSRLLAVDPLEAGVSDITETGRRPEHAQRGQALEQGLCGWSPGRRSSGSRDTRALPSP